MNHATAVDRRLSDPDFQGWIVHKCILLVIALSMVIVAFVVHDTWVWTHPAKPQYFFVDGRNPPRPAAALDSPIVDDAELLEWAVKWVTAPYNINYHEYPQQLAAAGRHYTAAGWQGFAQSYIQSGNFDTMRRARLLCYAQAQRAAVIRQTTISDGRLAYQIQFPMVQTCENTNQQSPQVMLMTAVVVRVDDINHPDGLAIDQLVARPN